MKLLENMVVALNAEATHSYSFECLHEFQTICDQNILNSRKKLYDTNSEPLVTSDVI